MAMTNYPTPANFLNPQPAWPVNRSCDVYEDIPPTQEFESRTPSNGLSDDEKKFLVAINNASNIYYNYTGQAKCVDFSDVEGTGTLDAGGWDVLACNQLAMPVASNATTSMFPPEEWNYTAYTEQCQKTYGLTPDYDWAFRTFGGSNTTRDFAQMTNIIFSNGIYDPWRSGGVTTFVNLNTPIYIIKNGAHHLDLREPAPAEAGTDVEWVREQETLMIERWITAYNPSSQMDLPPTFVQI
jgi:lysosomal Pro-X carboxypeptidase